MVLRTKSKEPKIIEYAQKLQPSMEYDEIVAYINRRVKWDIIFSYISQPRVKRVNCEICKQDDFTKVWCTPCIHSNWCCECCIALGIPNYSTGIFSIGRYKCRECGTEFSDSHGSSQTTSGLGKKPIIKPKLVKCPKCGTVDSPHIKKVNIGLLTGNESG